MPNSGERDLEAAEALLSIHGSKRAADSRSREEKTGDSRKPGDQTESPEYGRRVRARLSTNSAPHDTVQKRVPTDDDVVVGAQRVAAPESHVNNTPIAPTAGGNRMAGAAPGQASRNRSHDAAQAPPSPFNDGRILLNLTPDQRLQAFLIRQQRIAGIPPEKMIMMNDRQHQAGQGGGGKTPPIIRITKDGVTTPHIEPAQFNGTFYSFPNEREITLTVGASQAHNQVAQKEDTAQDDIVRDARLNKPEVDHVRGDDRAVGMQSMSQRRTSSRNNHKTRLRNKVATQGESAADKGGPVHASGTGRRVGRSLPLDRIHLARLLSERRVYPGQLPRPYPGHNATRDAIKELPDPAAATNATTNGGQVDRVGTVSKNRVPPFNILNAFFLHHANVVFRIAYYLDIHDLMNLYSISRYFMQFVAAHSPQFILDYASWKAHDSARIFHFRCYHTLSTPNPVNRVWSGTAPRIRWLSMICFREKVVRDIMKLMEQRGAPLPDRCEIVIKKLWFMMDICENGRRLWTVRNRKLWPDVDIFFANFFFVKLQLVFQNRPITNGRYDLRRVIMAQYNFILLRNALLGTALETPFEVIKAYVKWRYNPLPHEKGMHIFGVAPQDVGALQFEGYNRRDGAGKLKRPDELILRESVRRNLDMQKLYMEIFLHGNDHVIRNIPQEPLWFEEVRIHLRGTLEWQRCVLMD